MPQLKLYPTNERVGTCPSTYTRRSEGRIKMFRKNTALCGGGIQNAELPKTRSIRIEVKINELMKNVYSDQTTPEDWLSFAVFIKQQ